MQAASVTTDGGDAASILDDGLFFALVARAIFGKFVFMSDAQHPILDLVRKKSTIFALLSLSALDPG